MGEVAVHVLFLVVFVVVLFRKAANQYFRGRASDGE
jgi:hypothetical protein